MQHSEGTFNSCGLAQALQSEQLIDALVRMLDDSYIAHQQMALSILKQCSVSTNMVRIC